MVRSGPDLNRVRSAPPDDAWRNGRVHLVAYVGVIGEQEGIDLLIEAMEHIVRVRRRTDVQVVVMGSGPHLNAVKALSESKGLGDYITFTGRVDDATLFSVLSTAEVCVNPDRPNPMNDHSTMNKIMEYMALGKPMVQFDLTEGRVSAQEASLYARNTDVGDFGDKIIELLDDPERRQTMGALGKKRVLRAIVLAPRGAQVACLLRRAVCRPETLVIIEFGVTISHPPRVIPEAALYSGCPGSISPIRGYGFRRALAKGSLGRDDREGGCEWLLKNERHKAFCLLHVFYVLGAMDFNKSSFFDPDTVYIDQAHGERQKQDARQICHGDS